MLGVKKTGTNTTVGKWFKKKRKNGINLVL